MPPNIHALLAARLDRLEPEERAAIDRASVIGREFWRGAVADLSSEEDRASLSAQLMTLVRKDLIRPARSIFPWEDGFRFRHALIRDAAYLAIPKATRAELHERFADWLERTAGERASELDEILGYHLEQAFRYREELGPIGDDARQVAIRAGERLAAAGRRAIVARSDLAAAVSLLSRSVALLPNGSPAAPRASARARQRAHAHRRLRTRGRRPRTRRSSRPLQWEIADSSSARSSSVSSFGAFTQPEGSALDDSTVAERTIPLLEELGDDLGLAKAWWLKSEADVNACRWGARAEAPRARSRACAGDPGRGRGGDDHVPACAGALLRPDAGPRSDRAMRAVPRGASGEPLAGSVGHRSPRRPARNAGRLRPGAAACRPAPASSTKSSVSGCGS